MRRGPRTGVLVLIALVTCFASTASAAKKPNLKVTALSDPLGQVTGEGSFEVSDRTSNRGKKTANASITRFLLSPDEVAGPGDIQLYGDHEVPKLKKKKSSEEGTLLIVPFGADLGIYHFIACADSTEVVNEKNEADNCTASSELVEIVETDFDGDGVVDSEDNCIDTENSDQADNDADGKGNACDPCPSDSNPGSQGCPTTVYAINQKTAPLGTVRLSNVIVQAVDTRDMQHTYIAEPFGSPAFTTFENSGLEMTRPASPAPPSLGDNITVDGELDYIDGNGLPVLTPTNITVNSTGNSPNLPLAVTTNTIAGNPQNLHGVLVQVSNVEVLDGPPFDYWELNGGAIVRDEIMDLPESSVGADYSSITGIGRMVNAGSLAPRFASDIVPAP